MKLIHRIAYYLGGFGIGLIILFFFLSGKKTSCDYSPNARTLKDIRNKERAFSEETIQFLKQEKLDTATISRMLINGDVLFSESNTDLDSCKIYKIEADVLDKNLKITVENCEEKATVQKMEAVFE
ncbi:DUF4258 domain-containing protein [Marixanthomonas ophiurae]|uniref:DUF4258 domain-containing protein n=1 Tax=Marixanthomonas ophiurae TaxID=387659 RepID=A0A3E1Q846_9FLAO|nr:DUF4258 domain-containing protein [Marixanthomonas ophiurae]RFN58305.1 DUF4258 domain-containing protein [Marixanthomonas ophiurae]